VEKAQTEGFKSRNAELQEFLDAADKELNEYDERWSENTSIK
jgi:hypothetical protein